MLFNIYIYIWNSGKENTDLDTFFLCLSSARRPTLMLLLDDFLRIKGEGGSFSL